MARIDYICPKTRQALVPQANGLFRADGALYRFLPDAVGAAHPIPNFLDLAAMGDRQQESLSMYGGQEAVANYRNFLDWLFATFEEDEGAWRRAMVARLRLRPGAAVLGTGCGLEPIPIR